MEGPMEGPMDGPIPSTSNPPPLPSFVAARCSVFSFAAASTACFICSHCSPRATSLARSPFLFRCNGSTFFLRIAVTVSSDPLLHAMCREFSPLCVKALGLAPAAISARADSKWPF